MKNEELDKLETKLIKLAVKEIDLDKMAKALAKKIEESLKDRIDQLDNHIDFDYWIQEELTSTTTPAGKIFHKALTDITKRMATSI